MFDIMYARYILTIAALIVIILMDVLYFTKPKANKKLKHKMFSYLIIASNKFFSIDKVRFEKC